MGYCIEMEDSTFRILEKNIEEVVSRVREYARNNKDIRWVDENVLMDKGNGVYAIFEELRYPLTKDGEDYVIAYFDGEKLGDDLYIFEAIADLVEPSYIEYYGEDGDRFRFVFDGKTCKEVYPRIEWE